MLREDEGYAQGHLGPRSNADLLVPAFPLPGFHTRPSLWVELTLRVPMQGSSLHHPGSKRLREAGEVRAWDSHQTKNYGEWPSLSSAQYYQWLSVSLPPSLQGPSSPPRASTLAARWHCDPAELRPPAESTVWRGGLPSPSGRAGQLVQVAPSSRPARGVDRPPSAALSIPGQAAASATKTGYRNQSLSASPWGCVPGECGPSSFTSPSRRRAIWSRILKLEVIRKVS